MGQHKHNPTALAAARGEIKPKRKPSPVSVLDIKTLKSGFWPKFRAEPVNRSGSTRTTRRNRARRREAAALRRLSWFLPPQSGHRRPEFSSHIPGKWEVVVPA